MFKVDVHPDVYAEMEHSRAWYEERAENLGVEFLGEVDRAIETVREAPTLWPFRDERRGIRRYLVHRFPYGVVYRTGDRVVQIIAVMHLRRHPDYWRGRLPYWNDGHTEQPG
ncbi:MAG: type II toxin-antitoxin system RelE/ParE family toxin [Verrucomicrobia bacterium]|nr:type II toxin-antitoxin system RelE/ParE family toxin [Verrucomicrobiota bacterium]MBU4286482.1 type II toxin-antitoxin system RelE/ParE family toxin [Verrucomicrobiota bacterium]MBU4366638.1 type II toxin-antitoxin system RelE/ParE family toxin [Verrucomicrobiota bacterium]